MEHKLILGLDIGTNSIGWALINEQNEKPTHIIGAGSRIIPLNADLRSEFEQGNKITKNASKRQKRLERRMRGRYKLRRERLINALKILCWIPENFNIYNSETNKMEISNETLAEFAQEMKVDFSNIDQDKIVWFLRKKALHKKITLTELARILYHFNQRRGYQSSRKSDDTATNDAGKENLNKQQIKTFENVFIEKVEPTEERIKNKQLFIVTLEDGRTGLTLNQAMVEFVGQVKPLLITENKKKSGEVSFNFSVPKEDSWQYKMEEVNKQISESGLHPGEYFFAKLKADPNYRIKDNIVLREKYLSEINAIWKRQQNEHIQELFANPRLLEVLTKLYPNNKQHHALLEKKGLQHTLINDIIFYQRPLKSQKSSISECRFEKRVGKDKNGNEKIYSVKVCPKSAPVFQEFKIWQQINNIKVENKNYEDITTFYLTDIKSDLFDFLNFSEEKTGIQLKKEISRLTKLPLQELFIGFRDDQKISGNTTLHAINKVFKKFNFNGNEIFQNSGKFESLWHILYSLDKNEDVVKALLYDKTLVINEKTGEKRKFNFGFTPEIAEALSKIKFKNDYAAFSSKALKKMLPLMKSGRSFSTEEIDISIKQRIEKIQTAEFDDSIDTQAYEVFGNHRSLEVFNGLKFWEACLLVYGKHSVQSDDIYKKPENIKPLKRNSLRNPVVEQIVNETLQITKNIWQSYGRPDEIRIELARELKSNAADRKKMYDGNNKKQEENKKIKYKLINEFNLSEPSLNDIERYKLWEEARQICIYSGKVIEKSILFDKGQIDVDHILPKSRFFDDSFTNKVICFTKENRLKDKLTAWEYLNQKGPDEFIGFIDRLKSNPNYSRRKRENLMAQQIPDDFIERQKKETQYIAVRTRMELQKIVQNVVTTTGSVTDYLRHQWGLNNMFKQLTLPRYIELQNKSGIEFISYIKDETGKRRLDIKGWSKRYDNRAHTLDAIVIGCTSAKNINYLNKLSSLHSDSDVKMNGVKLSRQAFLKQISDPTKQPWNSFVTDVESVLKETIVSYKNRKRVVTYSVNKTEKIDKETGKKVKVAQDIPARVIRGQLHEETNYGIIKIRERVSVSIKEALDTPDNIIDKTVRKMVKDSLSKYSGNIEETLKWLKKNPIKDVVTDLPIRKIDMNLLIPTYVYRIDLNMNLTSKKIMNIVDNDIRNSVIKHLGKYDDKIKLAFNDEGLSIFNENRKQNNLPPITSVRIKAGGAEETEESAKVLIREDFHKKYQSERGKLAVKTGNNYCVIIKEKDEDKTREIAIRSFFDAFQLTIHHEPLINYEEGFSYFSLKHYDLVYIPRPNEEIGKIDWNNKSYLSNRIYRVVKYDQSGRGFFQPHNFSTQFYIESTEGKKIGDFKNADSKSDPNGSEFVLETDNTRTKILDKCIKLKVDKLSIKIEPVFDEIIS